MTRALSSRPDLRVVRGGRDHGDDLALAARVTAGDRAAAAEAYDALAPKVGHAVVGVLGRGAPETEDVIQTAFVELVRSLRSYRGDCSLRTWASHVATRVALNALRGKRRRRAVISDDEAPESKTRDVDPLVARRVRTALAELTPEKAEALVMAEVLGYSVSEIAALVGAGVPAVQSRITRAKQELRALLEAP